MLPKHGYTVQSFRTEALISLKSWKNWVLKWSFGKSAVGVDSRFKIHQFSAVYIREFAIYSFPLIDIRKRACV